MRPTRPCILVVTAVSLGPLSACTDVASDVRDADSHVADPTAVVSCCCREDPLFGVEDTSKLQEVKDAAGTDTNNNPSHCGGCNTGCESQCNHQQRICHVNCGGNITENTYCAAHCD